MKRTSLLSLALLVACPGCYVVQIADGSATGTARPTPTLRTGYLGAGLEGIPNERTERCPDDRAYSRVELGADSDAVGANLSFGIAYSAYNATVTCLGGADASP